MLGCEGQQPDISSIGCRGRSNEASLPGHELGRDPSLRASEACGAEVGGARGARAAISCDDGTAAGSAGMLQGPCPVDERHASGPWAYEGKSPPRLPSVLGSRRPALPTAFRREGASCPVARPALGGGCVPREESGTILESLHIPNTRRAGLERMEAW